MTYLVINYAPRLFLTNDKNPIKVTAIENITDTNPAIIKKNDPKIIDTSGRPLKKNFPQLDCEVDKLDIYILLQVIGSLIVIGMLTFFKIANYHAMYVLINFYLYLVHAQIAPGVGVGSKTNYINENCSLPKFSLERR